MSSPLDRRLNALECAPAARGVFIRVYHTQAEADADIELAAPATNHVNPQAYFTDLLTRLVNGWPQKRIDELMPWLWIPEQPP